MITRDSSSAAYRPIRGFQTRSINIAMKRCNLQRTTRALLILVLSQLGSVGVFAAPSDVSVIEKAWYSAADARLDEFFNPIVICEIERNRESVRLIREKRCNETALDDGRLSSVTAEKTASRRFIYQVRFRNVGSQEIVGISWQYEFRHPGTNELLGVHTFYSQKRMRPGSSATFAEQSYRPPTLAIPVDLLNLADSYLESVRIVSVDDAPLRVGLDRRIRENFAFKQRTGETSR